MEAVENAALPGIEIYCGDRRWERLAAAVGYGIEEEGLPYKIVDGSLNSMEAHEYTMRAGLGVVVVMTEDKAAVFTRQMRAPAPLFELRITEAETAKSVGKNAARIVKNKPFIDLEE
jgi:hypothetical protein